MGKKRDRLRFDSSNIVIYVWNRRKILILVSLLAFVVTSIVSLMITPKYKSSVVMFPVPSASVSGSLISENMFAGNELLKFGGEEESEQLLQVLQSLEIRERIVKKYKLVKHYGIDSTSKYFRWHLNKEYDNNIKFRRTEFMSIVIDVLDTDADTAAFIANDIGNFVDTVMNKIIKERAIKALALVETEYKGLSHKINELQDSLKKIGLLGVSNYDAQTEILNNAYAQALKDGNQNAANRIESKLNVLAKYGSVYISLRELLTKETERLSALTAKYQQAKMDVEQDLPYKFVVDKAYASDKKAYPKRALMVLVTTISVFFFALILLIVRDTIIYKRKD
jgi:uncharacterized protein involved in exopolysaccharide biosynthesis